MDWTTLGVVVTITEAAAVDCLCWLLWLTTVDEAVCTTAGPVPYNINMVTTSWTRWCQTGSEGAKYNTIQSV